MVCDCDVRLCMCPPPAHGCDIEQPEPKAFESLREFFDRVQAAFDAMADALSDVAEKITDAWQDLDETHEALMAPHGSHGGPMTSGALAGVRLTGAPNMGAVRALPPLALKPTLHKPP